MAIPAAAAYFVGDSITDIGAGHQAGVDVVAFANRPGKRTAFALESPAVLVTDWDPVIEALRATA